MIGHGQFETGNLRRWIALSCVVLALLIGGLEALHAHSDAAVSRNSSPCAICLSAHVNASTVNIQVLPQLHVVDAIAIPYQPEGKSAISELHLFMRPPPTA